MNFAEITSLSADITGAGFDLLTWRKGPAPDVPADVLTKVTCADDRGRAHEYDLADTTVELDSARSASLISRTRKQVTC